MRRIINIAGIVLVIALSVTALSSCRGRGAKNANGGGNVTTAELVTGEGDGAVHDAARTIDIRTGEVKSVKLLREGDGTDSVDIAQDDVRTLAGYFSGAEYDAAVNDSGIQLSMTTPDYTLIVSYGGNIADDDWMQIWSSGRAIYDTVWFNLSPEAMPDIVALLDKYAAK